MAKLVFKITIPDDAELTKSILMKMYGVFSEGRESSYSDDELNGLKNVINVISDLTESSHPRHDAELLKDAFNTVMDEICMEFEKGMNKHE